MTSRSPISIYATQRSMVSSEGFRFDLVSRNKGCRVAIAWRGCPGRRGRRVNGLTDAPRPPKTPMNDHQAPAAGIWRITFADSGFVVVRARSERAARVLATRALDLAPDCAPDGAGIIRIESKPIWNGLERNGAIRAQSGRFEPELDSTGPFPAL